MIKSKTAIFFLSFSLIFVLAQPAYAGSDSVDDDLSNVVFHTKYVDAYGSRILRKGVEAAWGVVKPYMNELGIEKFPKSHVWGFYNIKDAVRISGIRDWSGLREGVAINSSMYILLNNKPKRPNQIYTVAHEAIHLIQFGVSGRNLGSMCMVEGAAQWYRYEALESKGAQGTIEGWSDAIPKGIPAFSELSTWSQWNRAIDKYFNNVYALCTLAFDLLVKTGGGEQAYFNYLSELRRTNWRTAFNRAFAEDLATFEERFSIYRESGFQDYRLPEEVARDEFLASIVKCEPWNAQEICVV